MLEVEDLLLYLKANDSEMLVKVSSLLVKYSQHPSLIKLGQENLTKALDIDVLQLESLINPDKFDFPEPDLGNIGFKNEIIS